jgi:hypothetical protein
MKRRDFLKGLTSASVAAMSAEIAFSEIRALGADPPPPSTKNPPYYLNVFVHGMFAIVLDPNGNRYGKNGPKVRLLAPRVTGAHAHRYFSKLFQVSGTGDLNEVYSHEITSGTAASGKVDFSTPKPTSFDPTSDSTRIVILVDKTSEVPGKPAWTFDLPAIPNDMCQLRAAHSNYFNPGLTYMNSQLNFGQWFPVVNVLTYEFSTQPTINLTPESGVTPQVVQFNSNVGRIHLFAEPSMPTKCGDGHLQDAIQQFNELFHLNLDLSLMTTADCLYLNSDPIPSSCKSGILLCEERSLQELTQPCSEFTGRRPQVQQQYQQDEGTQKIVKAWKQFLASYEEKAIGNQSKKSAITKSMLTTASKEFINSNHNLLMGAKPPSNCMSVVCLNP